MLLEILEERRKLLLTCFIIKLRIWSRLEEKHKLILKHSEVQGRRGENSEDFHSH